MAYVITEGQITALNETAPRLVNSVELSSTFTADYATLWRTQPHVRTVVDFLARNIAQLRLQLFERTSDTDRQRLTDHPVASLFRKPMPGVTQYRLWDDLIHDIAIYDVACWAKVDGERPSLLRLPPAMIEPVGKSMLGPQGIRLRGNRGKREFSMDEVVLFRGYSPEGSWGVSPMETLRQILAEEWEANVYRGNLWRNGARFPGYIKRPKEAGEWSSTARARFRNDWNGLYTGRGSGAGGTPILEDGMEFVGGGVTPADAQYLETRKLTREEVAAAFHVPPPMVGILDHATFSNVQEQHKQLYSDTLGPWLTMIQDEIVLQVLGDFDAGGKLYVEFNMAEKLKGTPEEQASVLQTMVGRPIMTANEGRSRINMPRIDGGDELVTPLNVLIGGMASPTDSAPKSVPAHFVGNPDQTVPELVTEPNPWLRVASLSEE